MTIQEKKRGRLRILVILFTTVLIFTGTTVYNKNKDRKLNQSVADSPVAHAQAVETPVAPVAVPEPTPPPIDVVVTNPQGCDQNTQWIWSDGSCHNKEVATVTKTSTPYNGACGDNNLAHDIYMQESSCILDKVNSIGACGLGQALPCSKLSNVCPNWRTDYACQNQFFTGYAMSYGSWEQAHAFKYCLWSCYSTRTKTTENKNGEPWW